MRDQKLALAALALSVVAIVGCAVALFLHPSVPRIAYVRTSDLVLGYTGTKESRQVSQQSVQEAKASLDTLHMDYRTAVDQYNKDYVKLSAPERNDREGHLAAQEEQMERYAIETQQRAREADEKLMQGVLSQIGTFVEGYGKRKGYDAIFGTTSAGSLLYGEGGIDITDEVLRELNQSYGGTNAAPTAKN